MEGRDDPYRPSVSLPADPSLHGVGGDDEGSGAPPKKS